MLWKIEKAYSLGIPKKNLALRESQTEEEHAYARRRRVKTQGSLPSAQTAEFLLFGLIISGQIRMRRIDGWRELKQVSLLKAA